MILLAPIAFGFEDFLTSFSINVNEQGGPSAGDIILQGYSVFNFPEVWHNMVYLASWFNLLLALIVITFVTNDFRYRTLRQNIIDGMSKWEVVWAKELIILALSIFGVIFISVLTLLIGKNPNNLNLFEGSKIILPFFLSLILYLNFAYFLSSWLKRSGLVIGLLFLYTIVIENLISIKLPDDIARFLPMNLVDNMIPNPLGKLMGKNIESDFSMLNIGACLVYIALFIFLNYRMLKRGNAAKK